MDVLIKNKNLLAIKSRYYWWGRGNEAEECTKLLKLKVEKNLKKKYFIQNKALNKK